MVNQIELILLYHTYISKGYNLITCGDGVKTELHEGTVNGGADSK